MNWSASLTWTTSPAVIVASVLAVAATAALGVLAWRRSGWRRSIGALELLRTAIVALIALLLNQPEWVEEFRPTNKPAIAVLYDASKSMDTRDVLDPKDAAAPPRTMRPAAAICTTRSPRRRKRSAGCWASCSPPTATGMPASRPWPPRPSCD
jgi:hypothetical protein